MGLKEKIEDAQKACKKENHLPKLSSVDKLLIDTKVYKLYPFGKALFEKLDYLASRKWYLIYDSQGKLLDILDEPIEDGKKGKRIKVESNINMFIYLRDNKNYALYYKYHFYGLIWSFVKNILSFNEEEKLQSFYTRNKLQLEFAKTKKQYEEIRIAYANELSKLFFTKFPYLENNKIFIDSIFNILEFQETNLSESLTNAEFASKFKGKFYTHKTLKLYHEVLLCYKNILGEKGKPTYKLAARKVFDKYNSSYQEIEFSNFYKSFSKFKKKHN